MLVLQRRGGHPLALHVLVLLSIFMLAVRAMTVPNIETASGAINANMLAKVSPPGHTNALPRGSYDPLAAPGSPPPFSSSSLQSGLRMPVTGAGAHTHSPYRPPRDSSSSSSLELDAVITPETQRRMRNYLSVSTTAYSRYLKPSLYLLYGPQVEKTLFLTDGSAEVVQHRVAAPLRHLPTWLFTEPDLRGLRDLKSTGATWPEAKLVIQRLYAIRSAGATRNGQEVIGNWDLEPADKANHNRGLMTQTLANALHFNSWQAFLDVADANLAYWRGVGKAVAGLSALTSITFLTLPLTTCHVIPVNYELGSINPRPPGYRTVWPQSSIDLMDLLTTTFDNKCALIRSSISATHTHRSLHADQTIWQVLNVYRDIEPLEDLMNMFDTPKGHVEAAAKLYDIILPGVRSDKDHKESFKDLMFRLRRSLGAQDGGVYTFFNAIRSSLMDDHWLTRSLYENALTLLNEVCRPFPDSPAKPDRPRDEPSKRPWASLDHAFDRLLRLGDYIASNPLATRYKNGANAVAADLSILNAPLTNEYQYLLKMKIATEEAGVPALQQPSVLAMKSRALVSYVRARIDSGEAEGPRYSPLWLRHLDKGVKATPPTDFQAMMPFIRSGAEEYADSLFAADQLDLEQEQHAAAEEQHQRAE
ncbi:hypothetical protein CXG81DRAFT_21055 [Caulochytrium protostelioides]|uniref:Uncharacterized protein n=1 Tax=Caulochytrium protostelioides TaxID=1555241 RepID=A0A4V1ITZ5_9FUNG|nr:hypothetical protein CAUPRSCDRAFT_10772 [Caulochytrium protostelioides]RKO98777.1 hypothetical protein CXG81DRAFT_21055 [Caulochytrium protostelioides]|eukprot:RKO98777.1 hypothetical protein CXG81DRAFT_21055 [Caulochytrium protostelioides]